MQVAQALAVSSLKSLKATKVESLGVHVAGRNSGVFIRAEHTEMKEFGFEGKPIRVHWQRNFHPGSWRTAHPDQAGLVNSGPVCLNCLGQIRLLTSRLTNTVRS